LEEGFNSLKKILATQSMVIKIINRSKETFGRYVHPKARITATEK
jgi:hypothetical protein